MESVDVYRSAGRQPLSHEWPPFLKSYRRGRWDDDWGKINVETIENDAGVEHLGERHCSFDFLREHGFLGAPRPSKEAEKLIRTTLLHHGLGQPTKSEELKLYCEMAKRIFSVDAALFTMSCINETRVSIMAQCGDAGIPDSIPSAYALCSHGFLLPSNAAFVVGDRRQDWRTKGFVQRDVHGVEMQFFASVPLLLSSPSSSCSAGQSSKVHVGNLVVMRKAPWTDFGDDRARLLHDLAAMAAKTIEVDTLSVKQQKAVAYQEGSAALAGASRSRDYATAGLGEQQQQQHQQQHFVQLLSRLLDAALVAIVDLSQTEGNVVASGSSSTAAAGKLTSQALRELLPCRGEGHLVSWCQGVDDDDSDDSDSRAKLLAVLPHATRAFFALPVQSEGVDVVIVASWCDERLLDDTDTHFLYTAGVLLHNVFLREQALVAQHTQLRFVRSVQHEMRTPLNCILGYLELLGERPASAEANKDELLEAARLASLDLKALVNSVLDLDVAASARLDVPLALDEGGGAAAEEQKEEPLGRLVEDVCRGEIGRVAQLQRQDLQIFDDARPFNQLPLVLLDIDAGAQALMVPCPAQARRILACFLSNALRFTDGHGLVRVEVLPCPGPSSFFEVRIEDSGVGMSQTFLDRGYREAFEKASPFTVGAGVGATLGARLVEGLGGLFSVRSAPGQGTTVSFTLPHLPLPSSSESALVVNEAPLLFVGKKYSIVGQKDDPDQGLSQPAVAHLEHCLARLGLVQSTGAGDADVEIISSLVDGAKVVPSGGARTIVLARTPEHTDQANILAAPFGVLALQTCLTTALATRRAAPPRRTPSSPPLDSKPRILLVEDNPINMRLLTVIVSKLGYAYAEAFDGLEAVDKYQTFRPHVVLLDISLPHLDGFEVCRRVRELDVGHRPLIVATTALSAEADQRRGLDVCGMDHWRTKPLSPRALRSDLLAWLSSF